MNPEAKPLQLELHPILLFDPSSQVSGGKTFPSPHMGLQTEFEVPVQEYPVSTKHEDEHPSPEFEF